MIFYVSRKFASNKMLLSYIIVLALMTAATADVNCNRYPAARARKLTKCCNHKLPISDELKDTCLSKIHNGYFDYRPRHNPYQLLPYKFNCLYECVINETGIYSYESHSIVDDRLDEFLNSGYAETPEFIPVGREAFHKCTENYKEYMNSQAAHAHHAGFVRNNHHQCKLFLLHCMKIEVFKHCPEDYWSQSEECDDLHDFLDTCHPRSYPNGHENENIIHFLWTIF